MAVYSYKAFNPGAPAPVAVNGTIVAQSPRDARDKLRTQGLVPQKISAIKANLHSQWWQKRVAKRYRSKAIGFIGDLSTLLSVGTPILEAIDTLVMQGDTAKHAGGFNARLLQIRERIASGGSLADAMRDQPELFDTLSISIADVGENSGTLDTALDQLARYKDRSEQLKGRIGTVLIYPCLVLLLGMAVCLFLMTNVVPDLLSVLVEAGKPLPFATRMVKGLSDAVLNYWWIGLLTTGITTITFTWTINTPKGQLWWHRLHLKLPIVGQLILKQATVQIAMVISTLTRSGVVFDRAVKIARGTCRNLVISDALKRCESAVHAGRDIHEALGDTEVFPPMVVHIFSVGQQSGRLEDMLDRLASDYDRQITTAAARLSAVIEPVLIVCLAIIVGFIAFATILPILEAGNVL